ncbi:MAG: EAL domain-containing protein [Sulfurimonas sp.]|nr:EAL domain-containing protein [Sulfurimonas sp.]
MLKFHLNKKLFWVIALLIIVANFFLTLYVYDHTQKAIEVRAFARGESLKEYLLSMRYVYHQQFLKSGLDINETTVGFLPAHASTRINDKFAQLSKDGITIRNVTDKPRNPKNTADAFELEAIEYFKKTKSDKAQIKKIIQNNQEILHYTSPLIIEKYCISCHGKKEEVLPSILKMYDTAYDYKEGDIRGITSIKIPVKNLEKEALKSFFQTAFFTWSTILLLLIVVYFAINKLTKQEVTQKALLQKEVEEKTADLSEKKEKLEVAYTQQKHLFSILRTVADCNQILITAQSVEELIHKTALSMHDNTTFASVKISLVEGEKLVVKVSAGLDEDLHLFPIEEDVWKSNAHLHIKHDSNKLALACKERIQKYNLNEVYGVPLKKDYHANDSFGVLLICTAQEDGLSKEELDMIDELAGDIGFAINSFNQKEAINQLSYYDTLTYIPNQRLFEGHLAQALVSSDKHLNYGALLFLDFDDFRNINDLTDKNTGDTILQEIAQRLSVMTHQEFFVARHSGDKFLILLENLSSIENEAAILAKNGAQKIQESINVPFMVEEKALYLTCSIGIVLFLDHKESVNKLLNEAEYAMRTAKNEGKNTIRFYNESLQGMTKSRLEMLQRLKEAVVEKHLMLYFQKQFDKERNVIGAEALLRWRCSVLGFVSPAEFIPLSEESGLIKEIGEFVLESATDVLLLWSKEDATKEWRMSVNVSPIQFRGEHFVSNIKALVKRKNIEPSLLRIELTEGVLVANQQEAMQKILELKEFGFSISIDDFGTGYSSLVYLKNLKIDELKIDQSFVFGLEKNNSDATIIKTIIMMGNALGFEVIAEGVESEEQFDILSSLGCNHFQGYLLARPCPLEEL